LGIAPASPYHALRIGALPATTSASLDKKAAKKSLEMKVSLWERPQGGSSPHCGHPGQLQIDEYLNRAGVLKVEHPVAKMESVQLPEYAVLPIVV
jgi:hypothetical protein